MPDTTAATPSRDGELRLTFPLADLDALRELRAGQTLRIDGHVLGIRDATQIAMFDRGERARMDLTGAALIHTAPNVRTLGPGRYEKVCIGTTTSARMNRFTRGLMEQYGVRAIIGKGGLLADSLPVLQEFGGVYLAITGGAAALETTQIEEIEEVEFEELMPECLWKFRVRDFGPLTVAMDSHGVSLYEAVTARARDKLAELVARF
jgi:L(+)-tartrate dehydratase beta subunit